MKNRGVVTLVFDDGYEHIFQKIIPLLDKHQMPGVFAVPLDPKSVEKSEHLPITPVSGWQKTTQKGHELAAHSISHVDLTTLSAAALANELGEPARKLPATTLVYPGGAHNHSVVTAARQYYRAARTIDKGLENISPKDPMRLKTFNWTHQNFSVAKANLLALFAYLTNTWFIETYHIIDNQKTETAHTVKLNDFTQHIRFLMKLPIRKATIDTIIAESLNHS